MDECCDLVNALLCISELAAVSWVDPGDKKYDGYGEDQCKDGSKHILAKELEGFLYWKF